jgi:hypothetical protein
MRHLALHLLKPDLIPALLGIKSIMAPGNTTAPHEPRHCTGYATHHLLLVELACVITVPRAGRYLRNGRTAKGSRRAGRSEYRMSVIMEDHLHR